jgi:hypothetical protein
VSGRGLFVITELRRTAGGTAPPVDAERFEWSSGTVMPDPAKGGARAAPLGAWNLGTELVMVRTDYPGARSASVQVMTAKRKPFTWTGKWDDRWNFAGYAVAEFRRFDDMVNRANLCRFQFQGQVVEGLIRDFDPEYKGDWLVRYSFTVEVLQRAADANLNRSPAGPLTPAQRFDEAAVTVVALQEAADTVPAGALGGTLADDVATTMAGTVTNRDALGATLDQRDLRPNTQGSASLPRLATQFRQLGAGAQQTIDQLVAARSDLDVVTQTAANVLNFEVWSRSMRFNARLLLGRSIAGANDMDERASPNAERLYRPNADESLYAISRKFYGTPHAWRLIAERNGLAEFTLTGDETLIIPERG